MLTHKSDGADQGQDLTRGAGVILFGFCQGRGGEDIHETQF